MDNCSAFSHFLLEKAIFSQRQFEKIGPTLVENDQNQNVFKLADFLRSLTPSDSYDLALRLYILFTKEPKVNPEQEQALQDLAHLADRKLKEDAFNNLQAIPPRPNSNLSTLKAPRYQTENSPGRNDDETKSTINNSQYVDVFNYLHSEGQRKNYMRFQNEQKRIRLETEGCTFQPNASKSPQRSRSPDEVFNRLQQDLRKEKEMINSAKKIQFELRDCTFKPNITNSRAQTMYTEEDGYNSVGSPSHDQTFDRLYREYQSKRHVTLENELRKQAMEVKGCTFQPQLLTNRSRSREKNEPERYNQLYKLHSERQRSLMKKRIDKVEEEEKRYTFKPQTIASPRKRGNSKTDSKPVQERCSEWNDEKKRKIEERLQQKMHNEQTMNQELNLPAKNHNKTLDTSGDQTSAYERLYLDSSHKKVRKEILEKKVLKELGASFTPKTNAKRESSANKSKDGNAANRSLMFLSPTSINHSGIIGNFFF